MQHPQREQPVFILDIVAWDNVCCSHVSISSNCSSRFDLASFQMTWTFPWMNWNNIQLFAHDTAGNGEVKLADDVQLVLQQDNSGKGRQPILYLWLFALGPGDAVALFPSQECGLTWRLAAGLHY